MEEDARKKTRRNIAIAFSGSRNGMTPLQHSATERLLRKLNGRYLFHGDCVGADSAAHDIGVSLGYIIKIYPPSNPKLRAFRRGDSCAKPKPYLERNRNMIDDADILVAAPRLIDTGQRSGTLYCIRYANRKSKPVFIIELSGDLIYKID